MPVLGWPIAVFMERGNKCSKRLRFSDNKSVSAFIALMNEPKDALGTNSFFLIWNVMYYNGVCTFFK